RLAPSPSYSSLGVCARKRLSHSLSHVIA
ncbi:MAG: hypothetical protein Q605_AUC00885G0001, partial [Actinomyces urogenitalis DORA_12]